MPRFLYARQVLPHSILPGLGSPGSRDTRSFPYCRRPVLPLLRMHDLQPGAEGCRLR